MNASLRWKLILAFVLVFVAGAAVGFFGAVHLHPPVFFHHVPSGSISEHLKKHFRAELKLTPQQVEQISPIVDQATSNLEAKREQTGREVHAIFQEMHNRISPLLTPEQRKLLEQMEQRHRQMMHRRGYEPHPPPLPE
jgi:Spy/CpxP family protein refolding chaperone